MLGHASNPRASAPNHRGRRETGYRGALELNSCGRTKHRPHHHPRARAQSTMRGVCFDLYAKRALGRVVNRAPVPREQRPRAAAPGNEKLRALRSLSAGLGPRPSAPQAGRGDSDSRPGRPPVPTCRSTWSSNAIAGKDRRPNRSAWTTQPAFHKERKAFSPQGTRTPKVAFKAAQLHQHRLAWRHAAPCRTHPRAHQATCHSWPPSRGLAPLLQAHGSVVSAVHHPPPPPPRLVPVAALRWAPPRGLPTQPGTPLLLYFPTC